MQDTSHAQDSLHLTRLSQESKPEQVTLHGRSAAQRISSEHESAPLHTTSQLVAVSQSTFFSHARSPHTTLHGRFAMQRMSAPRHASGALQSITQTPSTHVPFAQPSAQRSCAASVVAALASGELGWPSHAPEAVHQPSTHAWPEPQSVSAVHDTVQSRTDGE